MRYLDALAWQKILFADEPNRFELLKLRGEFPCRPVVLRVHRNQGFEQVASALTPFLAFSGWRAEWRIGDYDDTLSFSVLASEEKADVELVWLDFDRYSGMMEEQCAVWLVERLTALRAMTPAPIVVANRVGGNNLVLTHWAEKTPAVSVLDQAAMAERLGDSYWDTRRAALTGSRLSDRACLITARTLGFGILPPLLGPMLKVLAVDLDHTIYHGVLGEDGAKGVELTPGHAELQELLVALVQRGLLLVVVSRNEPEDVQELFQIRTDFPLRPEHVVRWQIGWSPKSEGILEALHQLRVGSESVLFIDDNPGELTAVAQAIPEARLLFAGLAPERTASALRNYPALWPRKPTVAGDLRAVDLKANLQRQEATASLDPKEYLRSLEVELMFVRDPVAERARLAELSGKTNQFNLSLQRLGEVAVEKYLADPDCRVVMVWLKDRLADSGSVAAIFGRRDGDAMVIDELCISCRALGRYVEDLIIAESLADILSSFPCRTVHFPFVDGPRNQPARRWLETFAGLSLVDACGKITLAWPSSRVDEIRKDAVPKIVWRQG
ncbi:MAG: HAD-IIIC family phosphatase [Alphaproteobacteria bacterium]